MLKKAPPTDAHFADTATATKKSTTTKRKTATTDEQTEPLTQKFFCTHSAKTVIVKFGNSATDYKQEFGIKKDNTFERIMRNNQPKDNEYIVKIVDLIKTLMRSHVSHEQICLRFNDTQTNGDFSQTIRQYCNAISKPIEQKKVLMKKAD